MRMRRDERFQGQLPLLEIGDEPFTQLSVEGRAVARAAVDEPGPLLREDEEDRLSLADVEHPDLQAGLRELGPAGGTRTGVPCLVLKHPQKRAHPSSPAAILDLGEAGCLGSQARRLPATSVPGGYCTSRLTATRMRKPRMVAAVRPR